MIKQFFAAALILGSINYSFLPQETLFSALIFAESSDESDIRDVELYVLSSSYEEYLTIPDDAIQSYQLDTDAVYRIVSGTSVQIDSSGLVTPRADIWYWLNGMGTSWPVEGAEVVTEYDCGESIISVESVNDKYQIRINVTDYSDVYVDKVMDDYIAQNILPDMTIEEKVEAITKFPASYDYNASYSSAKGMIVSQLGGDCWASTDAIIQMAKKIGLDAWKRTANKDPGAGSGHMNAMVSDGVKYFELDAGYAGKAPRYYAVTERESLFSTRSRTIGDTEGIEIYQYDGPDTDSLVIPSSIGGKDVISIAGSSFISNESLISITLPSSLIEIGDWAFSGAENISEITIPENVTCIGQGAFNIANLQNINGNSRFVYENGVLYDVVNKEVVSIPNAESVVIPSGCKTIGPGAAYCNQNLKRISVNDDVTEIKEGAFYHCSALEEVIIGSNVTSIGNYVFYGCSNIKTITAKTESCSFGEYIFSSSDCTVYAPEGSDFYNYAAENEMNVKDINSASSVSGDLNNDGTVTSADVVLMKKYLILDTDTSVNTDIADITGNGTVNVNDLSALKKMVL